jgi:hypothetical protein
MLLADVRVLDDERVRSFVGLANERGIACGCLSPEADVASAVALIQMPDAFDFWFGGDGTTLPFDRALSLMTIESPRVLFVSADADARQQAAGFGIQNVPPDESDLERMLG